jgi:plastocyanin
VTETPIRTATPTPTTSAASRSSETDSTAIDDDITLTATDFDFSSKRVTAKPGKLHIDLENAGGVPHDLVIVRTDASPGALKVAGGRVSTAGEVGEIKPTPAATEKQQTFHLAAGHYVFFCDEPGHYARGMRGELIVK